MIFCANFWGLLGLSMPTVPTVCALSLRKVVNAAGQRVDTRRLLRSIGLDREAIEDPSLKVPYADMMMLSEHAARATGDAAFGLHIGERVHMREYGLVGQLQLTSSNLGEAFRGLVRYLPIWTDVGTFSLDGDRQVAQLEWRFFGNSLPEPRQDCEISLATATKFVVSSIGKRYPLREVWFQHAKPKDTTEHARIFGAPVHFGMRTNALLLDARLLDLPLLTARPKAHARMVETAERLLSAPSTVSSFSQCVVSFIRQHLSQGNDIALAASARHFGLSRRNLQRKLEEEHCSYRALVQRARQDLAQYLLCGTGQTVTETAYALGYSEPSAFQRAFQKWHGMPPGVYASNRD
jgi:AraC-like DNA-binding protein